ncbi:ribonuclease HII [uncultured Fusobacterium sp.]|uniref:ribonuclease HII n=1 Tax=uncultured Fusobacterium sp. TaxID=159267 RepID=UPI0025FD0588|nr:ribonuclease HII [uncultured Fusobacterium sp.]
MENNLLYKFDLDKGVKIIGVDEAGRGPLAGPVVAAAAKLKNYSEALQEINDSKKLTEKKREKLFDIILENFEIGIGIATPEEIDEINILNATFLAMRRALKDLEKKIEIDDALILVDGNFKIREYFGNQEPVIKGDAKSLSIAAASIIAKVTRDRLMLEESKNYPEYQFEKHKGYGTKAHRTVLLQKGPTPIHRKSFLTKILVTNEK